MVKPYIFTYITQKDNYSNLYLISKGDKHAPLVAYLEIEDYKVSYFPLEIGVRGTIEKDNYKTLKSVYKYCIQELHYRGLKNLISKTTVLASHFIFLSRDQFEWIEEWLYWVCSISDFTNQLDLFTSHKPVWGPYKETSITQAYCAFVTFYLYLSLRIIKIIYKILCKIFFQPFYFSMLLNFSVKASIKRQILKILGAFGDENWLFGFFTPNIGIFGA